MDDWTPKPAPNIDLRRVSLSAEEGFVLSRLDGATPVKTLPALTGLPMDRVRAILATLVTEGVLLSPAPGAHPAASPAARAPEPPAEPAPADAGDAGEPEEEEGEESPEAAGNYRQLFETQLHKLPEDQRAAQARTAEEPMLSAFCFDPVPAVIKALLENPRVGLEHARRVARHHRNPVGLEAMAGKAAFAADAGVRRWLVRNPQLPVSLFRRLYAGRRMIEQNKLILDRDIPEGTRRAARELLRSRFATGPAEERVELIFATEGRVLPSLVGVGVDGKTAALLCGRTYRSTQLIQNIARWSAAPPALIAHLLRQEVVRRAPQLRAMLARHPNAPSATER